MNVNRRSFAGMLILLLGGLFLIRTSGAFFSDTGLSTANTFQAATQFPTPTAAFVNHLVITEVLYDPSNAQAINGQGGENRGEFVEIYNPTAGAVNLTGWTVSDGAESESLSGTLNPGNFLILTGASESEFEAVWTVPAAVIYTTVPGGKIGNGFPSNAGIVQLFNDASLIDSASWGTNTTGFSSGCGATCPTAPSGQSLGRNPLNIDTDAAGNFVINNPPNPGS